MGKTKSKSGRNAASKSGRKAASKTASAASSRSSASDTAATSSSSRSTAGTVKDGTGLTQKQQSALERGGSLAQRNDSESRLGPGPDAPAGEITSAAPPNDPKLDEVGRASSPQFDEKPVTGKGKTATPDAPKAAPKASEQEVKPGEGTVGSKADKVQDITKLEDLPAGSSVDFRTDEVVIHAAIAGGGRRAFHGRTVEQALAAYNDFAENGPELFPGAAPGSDDPEAHDQAMKQFDKDAAERSKEDLKKRGIEAG